MFDEFGLMEEQSAIQTLARKFAKEHILPVAAELDGMEDVTANFPWDMIKEAYKIGFKTLALPADMGGEAIGALTRAIILDELAYADSTCAKIISQFWSNVRPIVAQGTPYQYECFLKPFRDIPTYQICVAMTEPDYGSDNIIPYAEVEGGLKLSATKKGDGYVLNGVKHFNSIGGVAELFIVSGRTDKNAPVHKGITKFLVTRDTPGFSVAKVHNRIGWRAYQAAELVFDNVYVPKENILGEVNRVQAGGRGGAFHLIELAANATGMARIAYDSALDHAKRRVQGGKHIIEHQYVAGILADMYIRLQAARSLVWHTAWVLDNSEHFDDKLPIACSDFAGRMVTKVTQQAVSVFGGMGIDKELPIERYTRDGIIAIVTASMGARKIKLMNLLRE